MAEPLQSWPATVRQDMIRGTYSERPQDTLVRFQPDRGADLTRQGSYIPLKLIQFQTPLTQAGKTALDTFYITTCVQGTSRVTRKNPKDGVTYTMKFNGPPEYGDVGPDSWIATLRFWQF